ncbi:hypothetical protein IW152_006006 [Coemansia sp. BCRC 34962]|nr:hypothetical protein IW152_006006 [Coemansia sp. BCRC 34962]
MRNSYSYRQEESKQLADAFAVIVDVLELVSERAEQPGSSHSVTTQAPPPDTKPKPPLLAHKLYYCDYVEAVKAQHPDFSPGKVKSHIATRWKAASEEVRAAYRDQYKALERRYNIDVAAYTARASHRERAGHEGPVSTADNQDHDERSAEAPSEPQSPAMSVVGFSGSERSSFSLSPSPLSRAAERPSDDEALEQPASASRLPSSNCWEKPSDKKVIDISAYDARKAPFLSTFPHPVSVVRSVEPFLAGPDVEVLRVLGPKPFRFKETKDLFACVNSESMLKARPRKSAPSSRLGLVCLWQGTSMEERQPYVDYFNAMSQQYDVDIAAYNARAQALLVEALGKPVLHCAHADAFVRILSQKPTRPIPVFRLYFNDVVEDVLKDNPGLSRGEAIEPVVALWKSASNEVRQRYLARHKAASDQYQADCVAYDARKHALLRYAIRKLGLTSRYRAASAPRPCPQPAPPPPAALPAQPLPTSSGRAVLPSFQSVPTGSLSSVRPIGFSALTRATLPSGAAPSLIGLSGPSLPSFPASRLTHPSGPSWPTGPPSAAAPAHLFANLWPAEATLPPASSSGFLKPTTLIENVLSSARAMPPSLASAAEGDAPTASVEPVAPLESAPSSTQPMSFGLLDTTETAAIVESQALAGMSPVPVMSTKSTGLPMLIKKTPKKKRRHAAEDDFPKPGADQSSRPHRKKKQKPRVVKTESNTSETTMDKKDFWAEAKIVKTEP